MYATIETDLIEAFVTVAEAGSFSGAAKQLGVTKGTVSRAIARLEESVGTELVHRTTRAVALSTAGVALYERAAPHLVGLRDALTRLPERERLPSGVLRLTAPTDIGIDLALRAVTGRQADSALTQKKLASVSMQFYAAPNYLARRGSPRTVGDEAHDWVLLEAARRALKVPIERPRVLANDFFFIRDLARAGAGVALLPSYLGESYVAAGELTRVLPGENFQLSSLMLLFGPNPPPKVNAFRDLLVELFKGRGPL